MLHACCCIKVSLHESQHELKDKTTQLDNFFSSTLKLNRREMRVRFLQELKDLSYLQSVDVHCKKSKNMKYEARLTTGNYESGWGADKVS